jgi:hypothetical protein
MYSTAVAKFLDVINWDKSLKSFPPCYSWSPLLIDFIILHPPPPRKIRLKLVCNVKIVYNYKKPHVSQDYA